MGILDRKPGYEYGYIVPRRVPHAMDPDELSTDAYRNWEWAMPGLLHDIMRATGRQGERARGQRGLDPFEMFKDQAEIGGFAGILGRMPAGAVGSGVLRRGQEGPILQGGSGGGSSSAGLSPPGGVPGNGVPQPLLEYPPTVHGQYTQSKASGRKKGTSGDRQWVWDRKVAEGTEHPATMVHVGKQQSPEALETAAAVKAAQRDIEAGNYTPMFDVSKRHDVDPEGYDFPGSTQDVSWPAKPETLKKYKAAARVGRTRLEKAFKEGLKIPEANNWYYMGQLEKAFVDRLGPEAGRAAFREKFAKAMATTTGGQSPQENLRMAMYGNFMREAGRPFPEAAHELPFPIGGDKAMGNIRQYSKLMGGHLDPYENPKRFNFEGNFLGYKDKATLDAQMTELMTGGKKQVVTKAEYGAYESEIINLAKKYGVSPREFQEVAWAGAKKGKEGAKYPGSKPMIQIVNEAIERTARITGLTPKEVLEKGIIESKIPIYSSAGLPGFGLLQQSDWHPGQQLWQDKEGNEIY